MNGQNERPVLGMNRVFAALALLRQERSEMELQTAMSFLKVAAEPGIIQKDLIGGLGLSKAAAYRNAATLGADGVGGQLGLGLVATRVDPADARRRMLYLTPKGRRLADRIAMTLDLEGSPKHSAA